MTLSPFAPVALFVYNRPENTLRTLHALAANTLAAETELYVFADGAANAQSAEAVHQTRAVLHDFRREALSKHWLKAMHIIERPTNYYLERNIIEGIATVFETHENIIVLEDDICTAPHFLAYMNKAFALYRDTPRVMHISGFTRLDLTTDAPHLLDPKSETYFTTHTACWGWGTWRDRWQQHFRHYATRAEALDQLSATQLDRLTYGGAFPCLQQLDRTPIPWDICWEIAVCRAEGLALSPAHTLLRNIGLSSGTHFGFHSTWLQRYEYDREPRQRPLRLSILTPQTSPAIEARFAEAIRDWGIRYTLLGQLLRKCYRLLRPRS